MFQKTENDHFVLKTMDKNLNLIRETASRGILKSADESHLYCISCGCNNEFNLELFDWNLNRLKTNIIFQNEDPKRSFYLIPMTRIKLDLINWLNETINTF